MGTLRQDVQFALRMMRKNLGFTTAAVLCLMLGIGATTGIFTVVNAVLLQPLPYAHPEQLIRIYTEFPTFPNGGLHRFWTSGPEFIDLKRDTHSWASMDVWVAGGANLAGKTQPVHVTAAYVSGGLLETLGVTPIHGRLISASDDVPGAAVVADISYGTWQSEFAGDPNIVGRETRLDGLKCTIIGVMPKGFQFPPGEQDPPQVWTALQLDPAKPGGRGSHNYYLLGRVKPGVFAAQAQGELAALVQSYGEHKAPKTHSFDPKNHTIVSFPLQAEVVSGVRPALLVLLGAVAFVLLIASVNVANLLLARAEARRREIAIRGALGASLSRLARQFVTEGILLSFCGGLLGVGLAFAGVRLVQLTNAGGIPRADEIAVDWRVLVFTLVTSLVTGVLFGLGAACAAFYERNFRIAERHGRKHNRSRRRAVFPPGVGGGRAGDGVGAADRLRVDAAGFLEVARGAHRTSSRQRNHDARIVAQRNIYRCGKDHGFLDEVGRTADKSAGSAIGRVGFGLGAHATAEHERHGH